MTCGIYGIRNEVNGKWYVGQGASIEKRRVKHFQLLRRDAHYNAHLQAAFGVYGENFFKFQRLEEVLPEMLDIREMAWIQYYKSDQREFGYNIGSGGVASHAMSLETRWKISKAHLGMRASPETLLKLSKAALGRVVSAETREKISKGGMGRVMSESHRQKLRAANLGRPCSSETRLKLSILNCGKRLSEGHKQKLLQANLGRVCSEETRKKIAEANVKSWVKRRAG